MRFGLLRFRSPLLSESFLLSFPPGTKMFQVPGFPSYAYVFSVRYCNITCSAFPHSDICGSRLICSSPQLFAACHVPAPRSFSQLVTSFFGAMYHRHPPYALCSLIFLSRLLILTYKKNPKISTRQKWSLSAFRLLSLLYVLALTIFFALLFLVLPFVLSSSSSFFSSLCSCQSS